MLDLLQNVLQYLETTGSCKTCILQITHDEVIKKKRLEARISSAIIEELKRTIGEEEDETVTSVCEGETTGSHVNGMFEGEVVSIAQLSFGYHQKCGRKLTGHKLTDHKLTVCKSSSRKQTDDKKQLKVSIRKKKPSCKQCKKKFSSGKEEVEHICLKKTKKIYKCKVCDVSFDIMNDLNKHRTIHEPKKEFYCDICGKAYATLHGRLVHQTSHKKKQYNCPNCNQVFYDRSHYQEHAGNVHNIKQFKTERGTKCVVYGCTVYFTTIPKRSFHAFPNPQRDSTRYHTWVDNLRKLDEAFQPPTTYPRFRSCMICSDHFTKDSFEPRSSVNELCNYRKRATLKPDAIPTKFFNAANHS